MWQPSDSPYGPPVGARPQKPRKPVWVQIGLLGVGSRRQAMVWFTGTLGASILAIVAIFVLVYVVLQLPLLIAALAALGVHVCLSLAAFWYWVCIRWMDRNDAW